MEVLGSLSADIGQCGLVKKPFADPVMVIDLEDEIEEEEEWEAAPGGSAQKLREDSSSCEELVDRTVTQVHEKEALGTAANPISLWQMDAVSPRIGLAGSEDDPLDESSFWHEVIELDPTSQGGGASSQHVDFVDLSSSESGDDGDIVEEDEEIITTLSSEDAALLAEVMKAIKGGVDLKRFKVESLKTYLRHHGLRMVGVKTVLLSRIQEHLKIKDGRAEELYPRSSFTIDCTGDVCLGDTVLFRQTVYDTPFDIERRCASGPPLGQRWVAGKVVNESYGAKKQQHTFTVEVLWSTGTKSFQVMRPVKIKGRNLYRIQTLRQLWPNETQRQRVLDEKHARGAEARAVRRAMKLRGRAKSRQDARVHPYLRTHPTEPNNVPPAVLPQNPVQDGGIHTQNVHQQHSMPDGGIHTQNVHQQHSMPDGGIHTQNVHQGSVHTPSIQHRSHTERAIYQERYPAPEPTVPRGRSFHSHHGVFTETLSVPQPSFQSEQNHHGRFTERHPAPASRGRNFHSQQSRHAHHGPPRIHVQNSMQHGRVHPQRQVSQRGMAPQNPGAMTIPCSNTTCENFGARQCISRSCASCCGRNGGRCPRHR